MADDATVRGLELLQAAISGDPLSLQILSQHFLDTLSAAESSPCPMATKTALIIFYQGPASDASRRARKRHPEIFTACARFLMFPRSLERLLILSRELETSAGHSGCDMTQPLVAALHRQDLLYFNLREERVATFLAVPLPSCMANVVFQMLKDVGGDMLVSRLAKSSLSRIPHSWPRRRSDIVPYGESSAMASLAAWVRISNFDDSIHELVSVIYDVINRNLRPGVLLATIFPKVFIPTVNDLLDEWEHNPLCSADTIIRRILFLYEVGRDLHALEQLHRSQVYALTARDDIDLLPLFNLCQRVVRIVACSILEVPNYAERATYTQTVLLDFDRGAGYLHSILELPHDTNVYEAGTLQHSTSYRIQHEDPYHTLLTLGGYCSPPTICGNPSCTRTSLSEGRLLANCAGCEGISYCSRACQKIGWRYPPSPHRSSCADVVVLTVLLREAELDNSGAALRMLHDGIPQRMAKRLVAHFTALYSR